MLGLLYYEERHVLLEGHDAKPKYMTYEKWEFLNWHYNFIQ